MRPLFKGGFLRGFDRGNYSREETIQGRKLFAEIQYMNYKPAYNLYQPAEHGHKRLWGITYTFIGT